MNDGKPRLFVHADVGGTVVVKHNGKEAKDNRRHEAAVIAAMNDLHRLCEKWQIPLVVAAEIAPGEMLTCGEMPAEAHERMHYLGEVMKKGAPWEQCCSFEPSDTPA